MTPFDSHRAQPGRSILFYAAIGIEKREEDNAFLTLFRAGLYGSVFRPLKQDRNGGIAGLLNKAKHQIPIGLRNLCRKIN